MLDAVLCEFEGVLANTAALRLEALRRSFADDGVNASPTQLAQSCAGLPLHAAVRAGLAAHDEWRDETGIDLLVLRAERHFAASVGNGIALSPGSREFIQSAVGRVRLALVTRAGQRTVEFVLSLAGLDAAFEFVIASEDTTRPKPSSAPYTLALERLARRRPVRWRRVIALEDGLPGVRAAHAAGIRCIAVGELPVHLAGEAEVHLPSLVGQTPASLEELVSARTEAVG